MGIRTLITKSHGEAFILSGDIMIEFKISKQTILVIAAAIGGAVGFYVTDRLIFKGKSSEAADKIANAGKRWYQKLLKAA